MQTFTKVGLDALLTPENCTLLLIDHQPFQLANVNSHEPTMVINNAAPHARRAAQSRGLIMKKAALLGSLTVLVLEAGCMMGPRYKRPTVDVPQQYRAPAPAEAAQAS